MYLAFTAVMKRGAIVRCTRTRTESAGKVGYTCATSSTHYSNLISFIYNARVHPFWWM